MSGVDDTRNEEGIVRWPSEQHNADREKEAPVPSPLPRFQIYILLVVQMVESITSMSLYPFINQLIRDYDIAGGDEAKVGYYAGLIESLFFATEALFVLQWSRLSDRIGRKPVLLIGTAGSFISMMLFGFAKTFWGLVISRCLIGMLNGNMGVIKSTIVDMTDNTNRADGFALMPIVWSIGGSLGPIIGGALARPHDNWPSLFSGKLWIEYPYFLPCAFSALFPAVAVVLCALFLRETVTKRPCSKQRESEGYMLLESHETKSTSPSPPDDQIPLRALFVGPVLVSIVNFGILCLLEIAFRALQPLFYATPVELGGLGLAPATIGMLMALFGTVDGLFEAFYFAKLVRRWGPKRLFVVGTASFIPLFGLLPVINAFAQWWGYGSFALWVTLLCQLPLYIMMDMAFSSIFMFIAAAAPTPHSVGATNGLSHVVASVVRAIGPALATSLFSLSMERNWLGGYAVYAVLAFIALIGCYVADYLPKEVWQRKGEFEE